MFSTGRCSPPHGNTYLPMVLMNNPTVPYSDLPEYLTPAEVQAYLSLSRTTVYDLLRRNEIQHVRFGRSIRIPKTALRKETASVEVR